MFERHVIDDLLDYEENSLPDRRRRAVASHLDVCGTCRSAFKRLQDARHALRSLETARMPETDEQAIRRAIDLADARQPWAGGWFRAVFAPGWSLAAAAILALVLGSASYWRWHRPWISLHAAPDSMTAFEATARAVHVQVIRQEISLDLLTDSPRDIRSWQRTRGVPFTNIALARPPHQLGVYRPIGAAVLSKNRQVSVVEYRVASHPVTLIAARSAEVDDAPRPGWISKRIFRRSADGLTALTWTSSGQTYALVSDLPNGAEQACLICHADQRFEKAIQERTRAASEGARPRF